MQTIARILLAILFALVTYLTLTPDPSQNPQGMDLMAWLSNLIFATQVFADKIAHFLAYGSLGFTAYFSKIKIGNHRRWTPLALGVSGAGLEGVQAFIAERSPEILDAVANGSGAIAGFFGAHLIAHFLNPNWVLNRKGE